MRLSKEDNKKNYQLFFRILIKQIKEKCYQLEIYFPLFNFIYTQIIKKKLFLHKEALEKIIREVKN